MKTKLFVILSFFVVFIIPFFSFSSLSKYQFENLFLVAKLELDNTPPEIKLISFSNTNSQYPKYANKTHTITTRIQIIEDYISQINLDSNHINVKVNNEIVSVDFKNISCISESEHIYDIVFTNVPGDGNLSITFLEGTAIDTSMQNNVEKTFYSNILIDNTAPVTIFSEELVADNYSKGTITVNEGVQPVNGWDISSDNMILSRNFSNPIEYELPIKDFAQNPASALVSIKKASNIILEYSAYDAGTNDTYVVTAGNIAGEQVITSGSICKTEALFIKTAGNIDSSSLKGRAFLYTYHGEGSSNNCKLTEYRYYYGYNPQNSWRTVNKDYRSYITLTGPAFTEFGGTGVNYSFKNTPNPIPEEIAKQYLFGLSGIALSLDDYSEYSIVYQIYVLGVGWLPCKYNGEETMYSFDKPFSAIRINIVPNSQRQYLIDYWNADN